MPINNKQKALITEGFDRLQRLNNINWTPYRDDMFKARLKSEKRHRTDRDQLKGMISAGEASRYFVVKFILDAVENPDVFIINDLLSCSIERLTAQALVNTHRELINEALEDFDIKAFNLLDYALMMKGVNDE